MTDLKNQFFTLFKGRKWLLHIVYWALICFLFAYQMKANMAVRPYPFSYFLYTSLIRLFVQVCISYSFLLFVIPLYKTSRLRYFWLYMLVLTVLWFAVQTGLMKVAVMQYPKINALPAANISAIVSREAFTLIVLFCFFIAFYYFIDIYDRQREIKLLEQFKTEKIALESSFLKSQVNPHFLFNTLNNIYALSLKKSEQTPVIIERLEALLHYMLYECKAEMVPLTDEFNFTNSYIALEKLRHRDDQCVVTVSMSGDISSQFIAPLLLINFLENAFKHGTKTTFGKSWINMTVKVEEELMHFNLQNSKPLQINVRQPASEYTGGIGLKNVSRRLQILYPGKHTLLISNKKDRFEVDLKVNLA